MASATPPTSLAPPVLERPLARSSGTAAISYDYESEQVLMEPYLYLLQVPGKQIRSLLINAFNRWLRVDPVLTESISGVIQMLHTASLLYDILIDLS